MKLSPKSSPALEPGGWEALSLALPHAEMQVIGAEAPMGQGHLNRQLGDGDLGLWAAKMLGGFLK